MTDKKKRILITATNSYIGCSFTLWVAPIQDYIIEFISCRTKDWRGTTFSKYDVILHVAGMAHVKETKENSDLYYKINCDLTIELAEKAKIEGVKQFIFLSSMSVYGIETGVISLDSPTLPKNNYGISKLQAERGLKELENENFRIAIIRSPMVYGKYCKGNYLRLVKLALMLPVFPAINNRRSMIFIDNLTEFIRQVIEKHNTGIFIPQNEEYVNTSEMVRLIARAHGKKIRFTKLANPLIILFVGKIQSVNKLFGNLVYEQSGSEYCVAELEESITLTEA